jgi:hypothetical protein
MESIAISGLTLYYDSDEKAAVDQLALACERSVQTISSSWQMRVPEDCRVYLLTSWPRCVFQGATAGSKILLGLTLPIWYREFKTRWYYAGGWSKRYGTRQVVGIKVPRKILKPQMRWVRAFLPRRKTLNRYCFRSFATNSPMLALPILIYPPG